MPRSLPNSTVPAHRELADIPRATTANANLRKADDWRAPIGQALRRAVALVGWSLKEFAAAVERDPRQCARWLAGTERPQLDAVFAVEALRQPLVIALSEIAGQGVEIETVVRISRRVA